MNESIFARANCSRYWDPLSAVISSVQDSYSASVDHSITIHIAWSSLDASFSDDLLTSTLLYRKDLPLS